jgi:hypothetical protein
MASTKPFSINVAKYSIVVTSIFHFANLLAFITCSNFSNEHM